MTTNRLWLLIALAAGFAAVGSASIISRPGDPDIVIDPGALSNPLGLASNFLGGTSNDCSVNPDGPNCFYNPFNGIITSLQFDIMIAPGLDFGDPTIQSQFTCSSFFFVNCSFTYDQDGTLHILFSGVVPDDGGSNPAMRGIPPLLPGCAATPDAPNCENVGHFDVNFDGWSFAETPNLFSSQDPTPTFNVQSISVNGVPIDSMPEPASGVLLGSALLAAGAFARYRRRLRG